jgi:DNA processing protein
MQKDLAFWVALSYIKHIKQITSKVFEKLLEKFGTAESIWRAKEKDLLKLDTNFARAIILSRKKINPEKLLAEILKKGIKILTIKDKNYPKLLKEIFDPPFLIYLKGEIKSKDDFSLAIVGSRRPTNYGREVTESLTQALVYQGFTIVSGMARGIDSVAHKATLEAGGRTIAVLGSGVDVIYPPENKKLYEEISQNGAVISEFPLGTQPAPYNFPQRNRIIAGLSLGVLVTEAAEKSGALITAGFAGEFGREVFAVPGPIYSKLSVGTSALIKDGAKLVYKVEDLLEELGLEQKALKNLRDSKVSPDSLEQEMILQLLQDEPKHIDEIIKETGLPASKVSSTLSMMELSGFVKSMGGGVWKMVEKGLWQFLKT